VREGLEGSLIECPKFFLLNTQSGTVTRSVVIPFLEFGDRPEVEEGGAAFIEFKASGTDGGGFADFLAVVDENRTTGESEKNGGDNSTYGHSVSTPMLGGGNAALVVVLSIAEGVVTDKTGAGETIEIVSPP
jgi:hypothetical protein